MNNHSLILHLKNISKLIIGGIFLIPLLSACSSGTEKEDHPLKAKITAQIDQSAQVSGVIFQKSVQDLSIEGKTPEDSIFKTDIANLIKKEISYAYEYYYKDPISTEFLEISENNDTTIAILPLENDNKLNLKKQKVIWDEDQEQILFLESLIIKKSWLYTLEVNISITFDSLGQYQHHQMRLSNSVPLISSGISAEVKGKLIYP